MNTYISGQSVVIATSFLDPMTRSPLTPTALKLRVTDPANTETDTTIGALSLDGSGQYSLTILAVMPGVWRYRWEASAPFTAVVEGSFTVCPTTFKAD